MKKLLVVGASEKQVPIIKRAKEMDIYVICIDGNPNSIGYEFADESKTIDINDLDACLSFAKEKKIDGVTTLSATATLPTVNYIAEKMNLVGNPFEVSEKLKSKYEIKKILKENGLNILGDFYEVHSLTELDKIKNELQYPLKCRYVRISHPNCLNPERYFYLHQITDLNMELKPSNYSQILK